MPRIEAIKTALRGIDLRPLVSFDKRRGQSVGKEHLVCRGDTTTYVGSNDGYGIRRFIARFSNRISEKTTFSQQKGQAENIHVFYQPVAF